MAKNANLRRRMYLQKLALRSITVLMITTVIRTEAIGDIKVGVRMSLLVEHLLQVVVLVRVMILIFLLVTAPQKLRLTVIQKYRAVVAQSRTLQGGLLRLLSR